MTKEQRQKFLKAIQAGHDPEAAALGAGLPLSVVNQKSMKKAIESALRIGAALLRSRIMEVALGQAKGDVTALERALARREALFASSGKITTIERVIFSRDPCKACGAPYIIEKAGEPMKFRPLVKLSDPPTPIPVSEPEPPNPPADRQSRTRAALLELVKGGNQVVEVPR